jgi:hypothetical protein
MNVNRIGTSIESAGINHKPQANEHCDDVLFISTSREAWLYVHVMMSRPRYHIVNTNDARHGFVAAPTSQRQLERVKDPEVSILTVCPIK